MLVALHTGMRKSEQLNLEWTDVDLEGIQGGEPRHMPMNQVVIEALQSLPRRLHNPFVFFGREEGQPLHNGIKHSDWQKYLTQNQESPLA